MIYKDPYFIYWQMMYIRTLCSNQKTINTTTNKKILTNSMY